MATQVLILLTLIAAAAAQEFAQINQTELQSAIGDMRNKSYCGFVILLNLLNTTSIPLKNGDVTFLLPGDLELSNATIGADHLHDFVLSHTVPSALAFSNLLRFPTGTLVPTSMSNRRLYFNNNGKAGLIMNNARVIRPNICTTPNMIKCHGISAVLTF